MQTQHPQESSHIAPLLRPPINTTWDGMICQEEVLSFKISRTSKVQVRFNGQVTQEAIKKLITILNLSIDTYPTQEELISPQLAV